MVLSEIKPHLTLPCFSFALLWLSTSELVAFLPPPFCWSTLVLLSAPTEFLAAPFVGGLYSHRTNSSSSTPFSWWSSGLFESKPSIYQQEHGSETRLFLIHTTKRFQQRLHWQSWHLPPFKSNWCQINKFRELNKKIFAFSPKYSMTQLHRVLQLPFQNHQALTVWVV